MTDFQFAQGSVIGRDHKFAGRNNQDGIYTLHDKDCFIAVVTDGCGSGSDSEIGAKLGARIIAEEFLRQEKHRSFFDIKHRVKSFVDIDAVNENIIFRLNQLLIATISRDSNVKSFVHNNFLFTAVGVCITPNITYFFNCGDGMVVINEEVHSYEPFEGNLPPYLGYQLLDKMSDCALRKASKLKITHCFNTSELDSFLIATDGIDHFVNARKKLLPGKKQPLGDISQFWKNDKFFLNTDMVRRKLTMANTSKRGVKGLLFDDTTLVAGRRITTT